MKATALERDSGCAIAIIGCAGRFPGAPDVATFWRNLCQGVESIRTFTDDELEDAFSSDVRARPEYVRARSILDGVADFDASFFNMHAREAALTDPQHRLFLECSWNALEDAGYDPANFAGSIGIYAGSSIGSYLMRNVLGDRGAIDRFTSDYPVSGYPELLGAGYDFLATRVAYKLNLRGPAMTLQSACSTSLLAVTQAAAALTMRQADMMLAGGVSISFPQKRGYVYQDGGMVSPDGHCRTFDANAGGTVFGDGVGVVLLKRLDDALAAGDSIYAVIRGFGVNNDGSGKVGYTAPSIEGQAAAVRAAHAMAGFDPRTIGFVECHGTATPLGDPIELSALSNAFGQAEDGAKHCALGSVKTNVGHLDVASGITGLIKAALTVRNGQIPPTLHYKAPNPRVDLSGGPFFVNTELSTWPNDVSPRRAGVSAFGVGGTNVHVVLESAPPANPAGAAAEAGPQLLLLSARSEAALAQARTNLATHLQTNDRLSLADVAHTLQTGRRAFPVRCAVVADTRAGAAAALEADERAIAGRPSGRPPVVAFMFPGQGAQYAGMARGLYERDATFRATFNRCAGILQPLIGNDLRTLLFDETSSVDVTSTEIAQPALFAVEYALAQTLGAYGITAAASVGHSVGEFVAACLAGVFSLEDALKLVAERGRLMRDLPPGAMLAVRAGESELRELLGPDLDIAALNAPRLAVVAGPDAAIGDLERRLADSGTISRRLHTSHAFHSSMMDPAVGALRARVAAVALAPASLPYVSGVTGTWISDDEACSPDYWAGHCRTPVRFADALQTLVDSGVDILIEVGPGATLSTFALQGAAKGADVAVLRTLPGNQRETGDFEALLETLGRLWVRGVTPDWRALHGGAPRARVALPTYPFERTRHWLEPVTDAGSHGPIPPPISRPLSRTESMEQHNARPLNPVPVDSTHVRSQLVALLEDLSGEQLGAGDSEATFLELGFDSLFLGRFVQQVQSRFGVAVTFRQLLSDIPTVDALAKRVAAQAPPEKIGTPAAGGPGSSVALPPTGAAAGSAAVEAMMRDQLQAMQDLMRQQLQTLANLGLEAAPPATAALAASVPAPVPATEAASDKQPAASPVEAFRVVSPRSEITPQQRAHIDALIEQTVARTGESKRLTQRYRNVLADPRVAAGFRGEWKEMVYPITCVRAKGARIWDADGNEYLDLLNGFGQTAFGHAPDFVVDAVAAQLKDGFAIGPQTQLAGQVAELFCELTNNERVTFCNTGSEAVMAALRVARTVTGRQRVVIFEGAYHGQFDEVLVKSARTSHRSLPVALGIPDEAVANITVLPYGAGESLTWIREHQNELAAVVVEPVQSRHPGLVPTEFLHELRAITAASGSALVFDEVVTGFRMHPGGMQAIFGISADLATYGKVVGGGLPIGILAGKAAFMDALDGGSWQYGDDSFPEVAPTFIAGTFVRHPLAMAAVLAVLQRLKAAGPELQAGISHRTAGLVARLNAQLEQRGISSRIETFGSAFYLNLAAQDRLASLLYYHLRLRGVYLQEGFPSFLGTEHTDADVDAVVAAFADSLDELQSVGILAAHAAPVAAGVTAAVPLTEGQTEIWLSAQVSDDASCAFNESVTLRLRGTLDEDALQTAWQHVVARHDALRAAFGTTGESMHFAALEPAGMQRSDLSARPAGERAGAFDEIVAADSATVFDLANGPLVRAHLVRLAPDEHAFVLTAHHIVCDGWSINVVLTELAQTYNGLCAGRLPDMPQPLAFATYARRQAGRDVARRATVESYWLAQFAELPPVLELPTDRPRPAIKTYRGATRTATIDGDALRAMKKAGARQGCTLFVTLLAAFNALVGRLADQDDVVVGVPAAGQALLGGETLVGHCVDFLPIRTHRAATTTFAEFLSDVKRTVLDAYEHQEYTLGTLVRNLELRRDNNRVPIAEIQFNLERLADNLDFGALAATVEPNPKAFVNFDLFLNVVESANGLRLDCDYNTDLFDGGTIDRWLSYYRSILEAIVAEPARAVATVEFLSQSERLTLAAANATVAAYPGGQDVPALFRARAVANPDAVAIRFENAEITYGALEKRVNQTSNYLLERVGGPHKRIAICLERSPDLLVALLGTLNAGCSYVPLDVAHPPARLRRILEDAGVAAIVCDATLDAAILPVGLQRIELPAAAAAIAAAPADAPHVRVTGDDPAYAIYTSGSTGEPKGVEIAHRSLVNVLTSMARTPGLGQGDVFLAVTTVSFDIAALELFLPLIAGATVAIASPQEAGDAFALVQRARIVGATAMQATPALWQMLLTAGFRSHTGFTMLSGGEPLSRELANRLLAGGGDLWNVYGPTETTIWSSCAKIESGVDPITVGTPIANTQFYILDSHDQIVPLGATGQLHIAGDGVARGYLNRDQLMAEKFVANPFGAGRMYRTGDSARMTPDGRTVIVGRRDQQVKLRGFRIELGEIEAVLRREAGFAQIAVMLREDEPGETRMVCYYVEPDARVRDVAALRALAATHLPDFMIPSAWMALPQLPLSVAGKLDRKQLPAPERADSGAPFRAPNTPTELLLAGVWADVLRLERVGLDDDFFALGGDSIQLFQITARTNRAGTRLAAKELLRHPTIGALARRLDELAAARQPTAADGTPASVARLHPPQTRDFAAARRAGEQRLP